MTSHFCNHSDPTPAQMLAGEGKYMIVGLAERGGWQLWETEGHELIISQDFLSDVRYVHLSRLSSLISGMFISQDFPL